MRNKIQDILTPVRNRLRNRKAIRLSSSAALFTAVICVLLASLRVTLGIHVSWFLLTGIFVGGLVAAALLGLTVQQPWKKVAATVDNHYGLKDRIGTALEFSTKHADSSFCQLQIDDARSHLSKMDAKAVVPYEPPPLWKWTAIAVAITALLMNWPTTRTMTQADVLNRDGIDLAAQEIAEELSELQQLADESEIEPLQSLVDELQNDLKALEDPQSDVRTSLEAVSEMQQKLQNLMASLDVAKMDAQLNDVADAMSAAEAFREISDALKNGEFNNAAEKLENVSAEEMDRAESRPTSEKLEDAARKARERDLKELNEILEKLADSVKQESIDSIQEESQELADAIRKHDVRKQLTNMLASKSQKLADAKKMFAGDSSKAGSGGKGSDKTGVNLAEGQTEKKSNTSSRKAGAQSAGNVDGQKTELQSQRQMARLNGQLGAEGDSEFETETTDESEATSTRKAQEAFEKYQKMSEAVLEKEAIPLGHRRTIRKYFELIRPTSEELKAADSEK